MAHELEHAKSMAYVGTEGKPWHSLGVSVEAGISSADMMTQASLDWTVSKRPMVVLDEAGPIPVPGKFALVRNTDNHILDTVGATYKPVQNHEAFDFFHQFVANGDMQMDTAGALKGGAWVWALAKVGADFELPGGDAVEGYLLFSNPHQWGKSVQIQFTNIRVVCNNTLTAALRGKSNAKFRSSHAKVFSPDQAKVALGLAREQLDEFREQAEFLASRKVTTEELEEYFGDVLARDSHGNGDRLVRQAMEALESQPGAEMSPGTYWHALNTVTYLFDHKLGKSADTRLTSAWFGPRQATKEFAVLHAVEMANKAVAA